MRISATVLSLAVASCGADPTVTSVHVPSDAASTDGADVAVEPPKSPPSIENVDPPRGAFVDELSVTLSGETRPGTAPISAVSVSGTDATRDGDRFSHAIALRPGVNVIGVRAEADDGERAVDGRAVYAGPRWPAGSTIPNAVGLHFSPLFLDDDEPDPDDLSGVLETLLVDPAFLAGLSSEFDTEYATLTPTSVVIGGAALEITPVQDALILDATLTDLEVQADVVGKGLASLFTGPATLRFDRVDIHLEVSLSTTDGKATAEVLASDFASEGFDLESEKLDELAVDFPSTAAALENVVYELIVGQVSTLVSDTLGGALPKLLDGLAYQGEFGTAAPIVVALSIESVAVADHGINLTFAATIAPKVPSVSPAPGSVTTPEGIPAGAFSAEPIALVLDDDVANQALFAIWAGGLGLPSTLYPVAPGEEPTLDAAGLPKVFQPIAKVTSTIGLPPSLGPRLLDQDALPFEVAVGETALTFETTDARRFTCVLNARAGFGLALNAEGLLAATVDPRPKTIEVAVGCPDVPVGYDAGNVAALLKLGVPGLLQASSSGLAIALPGLPLGSFIESGPLAAAQIVLESPVIAAGEGGHAVIIEGKALYRAGP
ncbi:MAG: hypothetical protein IV100_03950 [Myxococcales bacterium]|nr:hypothetical protein [Myxococcales bacterium]